MSAEIKQEKPTIYYRSANVAELIKPLEDSGVDFQIKKTGYSCQIITPDKKVLISASRSSRKLFASYKKLAAEVDRAPHIDSVPRNQIKYYEFSEKYSGGSHSFRKAYCVDIKSAYLSCLRVNQIISDDIFNRLQKLRKLDRLKSVGMLATKQIVFDYKAGKLIDFSLDYNAHRRSYFMLVCYEIGRLMEVIEKATGEDFLFFWVDGLYFRTIKAANIAKTILSNNGYKYSFDKLENLWIHNRARHAYIDFQKDSEFKAFRVSKKSVTFETDKSVSALIRNAEKTIKFNHETQFLMSVLGQTIINAIEKSIAKQYDFKEVKSAQFVFNYIDGVVNLVYSGIKQDGTPHKGETVKAKIDYNNAKFKMVPLIEKDIANKIGCKPSVMKMKVRADIGGFECECFFTRKNEDGTEKKVREVHLTKL